MKVHYTLMDVYRCFQSLVTTPRFTRIGGELLWQLMTDPQTEFHSFESGATVSGLGSHDGEFVVVEGAVQAQMATTQRALKIGDTFSNLASPIDQYTLTAVSEALRIDLDAGAQTLVIRSGSVALRTPTEKKPRTLRNGVNVPMPAGEFSLVTSVILKVDATHSSVQAEKPPKEGRLERELPEGTHVPVSPGVSVPLTDNPATLVLRGAEDPVEVMKVGRQAWDLFRREAERARECVTVLTNRKLFANATETQLSALLDYPAVWFREFETGVDLCLQDTFATTAYFIIEGKVEAHETLPNGTRTSFGELPRVREDGEEEWFFGEIAGLSLRKRIATVTTRSRCVLLEVDGRPLRGAFDEIPALEGQVRQAYLRRGIKGELYEDGLLVGLDPASVDEILKEAEPHVYRKGEEIVREGVAPGAFHLILKGTAQVTRKGPDGRNRVIGLLEEGNYFGHVSLVVGIPPMATVTALGSPKKVRKDEIAAADEVVTASLSLDDFARVRTSHAAIWTILEQEARELLGLSETTDPTLNESFREMIAREPYFEHLSSDALGTFTRAHLHEYDPTDVACALCQEHEEVGYVYFILSGYVQVRRAFGAQAEEETVAHLGPGMWIGEVELLTDPQYTQRGREEFPIPPSHQATVKPVTHVRALRISASDFLNHLRTAPALREVMVNRARERATSWWRGGTPVELAVEMLSRERLLNAGQLRVVDLDKCVRCGNCVTACAETHDDGISRFGWMAEPPRRLEEPLRWLPTMRLETLPNLLFPGTCRHCEDAPCLFDCPTAAITRGRNLQGEIYVDFGRCIGCRACEGLCPFGAIQMVDRGPGHEPQQKAKPSFLARMFAGRNATSPPSHDSDERDLVSVKCDLCRGRDFQACVHHCPVGAVICVESPDSLQDIIGALAGEQKR